MGFSRLRLLPKATGVRPIATLCKREVLHLNSSTRMGGAVLDVVLETESDEEIETPFGPGRKKRKLNPSTETSNTPVMTRPSERYIASMSTNSVLADAFAVLSYEHSKKEDAFGAGLPGLGFFYPRYRHFVENHRPREPGAKKMYFGSVDIRHCYDNIDQEHLLNVVAGILSEDDYLIQRYSVLHPFDSMGRVVKRKKKQVGPPETFVPFSKTAVDLTGRYHRTVFVDGVACALVKKGQLMEQLREHLTSHLVTTRGRYRDRYLVQSTGIPQGSVMSSMLCNYYYASVESKLLSEHFEESTTTLREDEDFLVRMVDDYMLVTTSLVRLGSFLKKMKRGEPSLGVHINEDKTKVSVDIEIENDDGTVAVLKANTPMQPEFFPWCGMLFDTCTGEVRIDYSRFFDGKASNGLTVDRTGGEGKKLMVQMKTFVRPRCIPILFDPLINSRKTQVVNFYQAMVLGAVKTAEYLRTGDMVGTTTSSIPFLLACIESTIILAYDLINDRLQTSKYVTKISIKQSVAVWLGWRAFDDVFRELAQFTEFSSCIAKQVCASDECRSLEKTVSCALREIHLQKLLDKSS
jgi:telomerase reverse transcriptase